MTGGGEYQPGPSRKKLKPGVAKRVSDRKAFVSEKKASKGITDKQANQRFFVQTRMSEMKAKGKTVTPEMRKQLQQKFQSGDVARKGFAAPKKKTGGSSSSSSSTSTTSTTKPTVTSSSTTSTSTPKVQPRTDTEGRMGRRRSVNSAMKPQPGKPGYSAANLSPKSPYARGQHSQRSAPQVIRSRDTELRGSTKRTPAYKTK
jgi:hypothetical protein